MPSLRKLAADVDPAEADQLAMKADLVSAAWAVLTLPWLILSA